jgi:hypothetical protein
MPDDSQCGPCNESDTRECNPTCPHVPFTPHPSTKSFALADSWNSAAWPSVMACTAWSGESTAEVATRAERRVRRAEEAAAARTGFARRRAAGPAAERARQHWGAATRDMFRTLLWRTRDWGGAVWGTTAG